MAGRRKDSRRRDQAAGKAKAYQKQNPKIERARRLKRDYGISQAEYTKISEEQGNVCAICGNPESRNQPLAVDHDHATGTIRGLLCNNCNTGIGLLKDSSELLDKASAYLKANGC